MFSKIHSQGAKAVAYDTGDNKLVYYKKPSPNSPFVEQIFTALGEFEPWVWGDSLVYVVGKRGSGKSRFANKYINSYVEATDGKVFIVSRFEEDPSITLPERGLHINIEDIGDMTIEDLSNSLVVFDDIKNSSYTREQVKQLNDFIHDVMENSRHYNINVLVTSHVACDYSRTVAILNESSAFVVFPQYANRYQINRALKYYFSLNTEQIERIMTTKNTRWVMVNVSNPTIVLTQKEIYNYKN